MTPAKNNIPTLQWATPMYQPSSADLQKDKTIPKQTILLWTAVSYLGPIFILSDALHTSPLQQLQLPIAPGHERQASNSTRQSEECWACPAITASAGLCLEFLSFTQLLISIKFMRIKSSGKPPLLHQPLLSWLVATSQPCGEGRTSEVGRLQAMSLWKPWSSCSSTRQDTGSEQAGHRQWAELPYTSLHPDRPHCTSPAHLVVPMDLEHGPKSLTLRLSQPQSLAAASASEVVQHEILKYKQDHKNYWKLPTPIWNFTQDRKP